VFQGFIEFLQDSYSTVEELNRQWGLTYWSHRLTHWSELWTPDGNHSPQYQIEWRRYQTALVTDFIAWEARIVREYASPDHASRRPLWSRIAAPASPRCGHAWRHAVTGP
jgi:beta-galactosidase